MADTFALLSVTLLIFNIHHTHSAKSVDSEVVCLYDEWTKPIENIDSEQRFFELLPRSDSGAKSENTVLLHLYTPQCTDSLSHPFFGGAHYQTGPAVLHIAQMDYSAIQPHIFSDWNLPSNCSLFVMIPIESTFSDHHTFDVLTDTALPKFTAFIHRNRKSQVEFTNDFGGDVKFWWYEKNPKFLDTLSANTKRTEHTFLGHIFKATDASDDSFIDLYVVDGEKTKSISRAAMSEWCRAMAIDIDAESAQCVSEYEAEMIDWAYKFWARKREALNFAQPQIVPNFTTMGFKKTRLPNEVFAPIEQFWKDKKETHSFSSEGYAGPVLNQYSSPTAMAHLGSAERDLLIKYFRVALSEWAGLSDPELMKMTSLYGIREYSRGAVLHMHVDTCSTHVLSAIVNVDSALDAGKDWPLQIYDHSGTLHEMGMVPGDVVFYESAKCGHSRRKPLPGDYYANLFIHYKPAGHWDFDWF